MKKSIIIVIVIAVAVILAVVCSGVETFQTSAYEKAVENDDWVDSEGNPVDIHEWVGAGDEWKEKMPK